MNRTFSGTVEDDEDSSREASMSLEALVNYLAARVEGLKAGRSSSEEKVRSATTYASSLEAQVNTLESSLEQCNNELQKLRQQLELERNQPQSRGPETPTRAATAEEEARDPVIDRVSRNILEAARAVSMELVKAPADQVNLDIQGRTAKSKAILGRRDGLEQEIRRNESLLKMRSLKTPEYIGCTLLHHAAENGKTDICKLLLSEGVDPNITDVLGRTPLHMAARKFQNETAEFLTQEMGDVRGENAPRDAAGTTPAAYSALVEPRSAVAREQRVEALQLLHRQGDASISPFRRRRRPENGPARRSNLGNEETDIIQSGMEQVSLNHRTSARLGPTSYEHGHSSRPGYRVFMEDAVCISSPLAGAADGLSLFAVFDGHGGEGAANYCAENLPSILTGQPEVQSGAAMQNATSLTSALTNALMQLDARMASEPKFMIHEIVEREAMGDEPAKIKRTAADKSGTTATVLAVASSFGVAANIGDSRTVVFDSDSQRLVLTSRDQAKPKVDEQGVVQGEGLWSAETLSQAWAREVDRIERAGGSVSETGRVSLQGINGSVAMTRALGDFEFKLGSQNSRVIESTPECITFERSMVCDQYALLACDGVWDVKSSHECVMSFVEALQRSSSLDDACDSLTLQCIDSYDNVSLVAIRLPPVPGTSQTEMSVNGHQAANHRQQTDNTSNNRVHFFDKPTGQQQDADPPGPYSGVQQKIDFDDPTLLKDAENFF